MKNRRQEANPAVNTAVTFSKPVSLKRVLQEAVSLGADTVYHGTPDNGVEVQILRKKSGVQFRVLPIL